eukprot:21570-Heterococcus_DN1.PRE.6
MSARGTHVRPHVRLGAHCVLTAHHRKAAPSTAYLCVAAKHAGSACGSANGSVDAVISEVVVLVTAVICTAHQHECAACTARCGSSNARHTAESTQNWYAEQ